MAVSFSEIAAAMDPIEPPASLRALAARHRWLSGDPPATVSLAEIAARHQHPSTSRLTFLWYNTFLLQGFEVSLCNLIVLGRLLEKMQLDPRKMINDLGLGPAQIIDAVKMSKKQLVGALGISLETLKDAFAGVVDGLTSAITLGAIDLGVDDILDEVSVQDLINTFDITVDRLLDQAKVDPLVVLSKFCNETIGLISAISGAPLDTKFFIAAKPEREQRAREIGAAIGPDYDVAALCEAFEPASQDRIVINAKASKPGLQAAVGPDAEGELAGSGLLTLALGRALAEPETRYTFSTKGDPLRDSDAWSNKGVLRTVIDVGLGRLEIYSTHLMAGGDFDIYKYVGLVIPDVNPSVFTAQRAQLAELRDFYRSTHNPRNVALIVGDFNLSALDEREYGAVIDSMHELNMLDVWPYHRHRNPPTTADATAVPRGDTSASNDGNSSSEVGRICDLDSAARYCVDTSQPEKTSRIDYIFVENPRPEHTFTLDVRRVLRRPFPRTAGSEKWLSDHLGLDTVLIVSPR